ncbi:hypothetical protein Tco_0485515 [Tanacetum coccineum]
MVGDLVDKGVASIVTSSPSSGTISKHCLSSLDSLSPSNFCFLELSCSSSSLALLELLSYAIFASALTSLPSTNSLKNVFFFALRIVQIILPFLHQSILLTLELAVFEPTDNQHQF